MNNLGTWKPAIEALADEKENGEHSSFERVVRPSWLRKNREHHNNPTPGSFASNPFNSKLFWSRTFEFSRWKLTNFILLDCSCCWQSTISRHSCSTNDQVGIISSFNIINCLDFFPLLFSSLFWVNWCQIYQEIENFNYELKQKV